jgi:hypothetical protein
MPENLYFKHARLYKFAVKNLRSFRKMGELQCYENSPTDVKRAEKSKISESTLTNDAQREF